MVIAARADIGGTGLLLALSAMGRAGSIIGPAIAGVLIAFALAGKDIVLLTGIPVPVAAGCALALARRSRGSSATSD